MNNNKQLVLAVFLGNIALTDAIRLNSASQKIPDYWNNGYSDTWDYTAKPRYVNSTSWEESDPDETHAVAHGTAVQLDMEEENLKIPDYWNNGYSDTWEYTNKPRYVNETGWVDDEPKDYVIADNSHGGGVLMVQTNEDNVPSGEEFVAIQIMTSNGIKTVNVGEQQDNINLNQKKNYDHLHEQTSWVEPYTVRDHSWNIPEMNQMDEHVYKAATQAEVAADSDVGAYDEDTPTSTNNSRNQYTDTPWDYTPVGSLAQQQQKNYDHTHEQTSWVEPYITRDHAWSIPEMNQSDEQVYHAETKAEIAVNHTAGDYGELDFDMHSNNTRHQYTEDLQFMDDMNAPKPIGLAQAQYDHLHEQESWVEPYTVRDHSWNLPEMNQSDEVVYHTETKAEIAAQGHYGDYDEDLVYPSSNNSRHQYTDEWTFEPMAFYAYSGH